MTEINNFSCGDSPRCVALTGGDNSGQGIGFLHIFYLKSPLLDSNSLFLLYEDKELKLAISVAIIDFTLLPEKKVKYPL